MRAFSTRAALAAAALLLAACAPSTAGRGSFAPALAVSPAGDVAWTVGGRAFIARPPAYRAAAADAPALASDLAWRGGELWLALPGAGLLYRAGGVPASVELPGRPLRLTATLAFAEGGNVHDARGALHSRLPGTPDAVLEAGGSAWAVVAGTVYEVLPGRAVAREKLPDSLPAATLLPAGRGYAVVSGPATQSGASRYFPGAGGPVRAAAPSGNTGGLIASGGEVLATLDSGRVRVYTLPDLKPLADIPLEVK